MTKERKIEILKDLLVQLSDSANILCTCEADERCEVVEECIKALEQQTNDCKIFGTKENCFGGATENECEHCDYKIQKLEQPTSEDCVSRQAVLSKAELIQLEDGQSFMSIDTEDVKALPSVAPTQCIATVQFSKEDLREICNERIEIECTHGTCMNCKHNRPNSYARTMFSCESGNRFKLRDCENFYCADFEKRGNGND